MKTLCVIHFSIQYNHKSLQSNYIYKKTSSELLFQSPWKSDGVRSELLCWLKNNVNRSWQLNQYLSAVYHCACLELNFCYLNPFWAFWLNLSWNRQSVLPLVLKSLPLIVLKMIGQLGNQTFHRGSMKMSLLHLVLQFKTDNFAIPKL